MCILEYMFKSKWFVCNYFYSRILLLEQLLLLTHASYHNFLHIMQIIFCYYIILQSCYICSMHISKYSTVNINNMSSTFLYMIIQFYITLQLWYICSMYLPKYSSVNINKYYTQLNICVSFNTHAKVNDLCNFLLLHNITIMVHL